jgi:polysaccharide export outer membrane protein
MKSRYSLATVTSFAACLLSIVVHAARADNKERTIGPDDVIEITLLNHPDLNKTLTVLPDGSVTYPWVGKMRVAGRTPSQVSEQIRTELEKTKNNVVVSVGIKEVHSCRARIVGAVKAPNAYDLKPNWRALDLIAVAEGLSARPARVTGRIVHVNGKVIPLDIQSAMAAPDSSANPLIEPDDLILLDEMDPTQNKVFVMGQVNKPGAVQLGDDSITLVSLLSQVGNTTENAALTRAYVIRGDKHIPLNLRPLVAQGKVEDSNTAFKFQAGDVLFVPELDRRVGIMGQVNKPGYYSLPEARALTVLDALALAGGQSQTGDLHRAGIIRLVNGRPAVIQTDIERMIQKPDPGKTVVLEADDVLFIPTKGERPITWRDVLSPIANLFGFHVLR